jgi:hypothetical protein
VLALPAERLVLWLRIAMTVGALGCAFLLDDPSEPTTEGVAGSLLLRRSLRVALLLPATAAWWAATVWRVRAVHPGLPLPVAALTLEAAALLAVTVALAAAGSRLSPPPQPAPLARSRARPRPHQPGRKPGAQGSPDAAGRVVRSELAAGPGRWPVTPSPGSRAPAPGTVSCSSRVRLWGQGGGGSPGAVRVLRLRCSRRR